MRVRAVPFCDLGSSELARWHALQAAAPSVQTPFFAPAFATFVSRERRDVRIAVIEDGGKIQGFCAVHKLSPFTAIPLGAPLSLYHGLIADPDLDVSIGELCESLGVGRLDF